MIYEFDFQFTEHPDLWVRTDITVEDALECLKTGLLKNSQVSRVKLFAINEGDVSVSFIYDITAAKSGNQPWTIQ